MLQEIYVFRIKTFKMCIPSPFSACMCIVVNLCTKRGNVLYTPRKGLSL